MKTLIMLGSLNMFIAVALGAFGAHALKKRLSEDMMKVYQTGIQYHIAHALGLLLLGPISESVENSSLVIMAGYVLFAGIFLFSGSLYALSLSGVRKLGAITPLGGLAFLAGWIILMIAVA
ncbi:MULTISPECIES: DUF423 domain-containing protein [Paenibacillus]|uniref:Membrane protein n=1 Tax=Paenibacillus naphthalenovorans TaxID=162209 RepID=A0A0U2VM95_9BACL|nr:MULTISPECIES: DUF423 domain-containing protein [Paenibacillus]ALS21862.1 membrane protein [Paenibacillus naphthalenovorans]NTZ16600.1 DUF423 domain-containing protein [Paenibacillus sp. JMULE4]GCL71593.1 DUF423 domain-containing protein [Paenibacillus naphthalenovorans]SDI80157.1 Uncharacterized membrane protein YgdD, TMEM256/DUF423 family [Paenibacillus naphthalenovorans]